MKNIIILINLCIMVLIMSMASVKILPKAKADKTNRTTQKARQGNASEILVSVDRASDIERSSKNESPIQSFVYDISEARIMDREEGRLASQRATFRALKDYGSLMVTDQTEMMKDLNKIATIKKVSVATVLGDRKTAGLSDLQQLHGENFDKKFVKMMIIDHKRDIKKLEKASMSNDPDIQVFAVKYLPVVKSHLSKIQSIRESM